MRPDGVRGLPGLAVDRGERIAIVAGATPPEVGLRLGTDAPITTSEFLVSEGWRLLDLCNEVAHPLPLGAVVCTVVVDDALPIVDDLGGPEDPLPRICNPEPVWPLRIMRPFIYPSEPITDQLPLGDFTPGRWGYMMVEPIPVNAIPCKGRQGIFKLPPEVEHAVCESGAHL